MRRAGPTRSARDARRATRSPDGVEPLLPGPRAPGVGRLAEAADACAAPTPVPPSALRLVLAAIRHDLLDRRPIGGDDFFRDRRGNPLACLQLLLAVHRRFGVDVPMRSFVEHTSFDALVRSVIAGRAPEPLCVIGL